MNRVRLDVKYRIKQILKKPSQIKEYLYHIKCWWLEEWRKDNSWYWNSKYNIPFRRTPHWMIYEWWDVFEKRNWKWYIAKEII